jgi:hypothetical protein
MDMSHVVQIVIVVSPPAQVAESDHPGGAGVLAHPVEVPVVERLRGAEVVAEGVVLEVAQGAEVIHLKQHN